MTSLLVNNERRRNQLRAQLKIAVAALEASNATADLAGDVLEVRASDGTGRWVFSLDGRTAGSMRALPVAKVYRSD